MASPPRFPPIPPKRARKRNPIARVHIHPTVPSRILLVGPLGRRDGGVGGAQPGSVAVRLHPVVLELLGLGGEHVGELTECNARGNVAGGGQELGAFATALGEPAAVC